MSLINSKLDDFFGLSEYDWTPTAREDAPSMYLYELVNWLTTIVDSLQISDEYSSPFLPSSPLLITPPRLRG